MGTEDQGSISFSASALMQVLSSPTPTPTPTSNLLDVHKSLSSSTDDTPSDEPRSESFLYDSNGVVKTLEDDQGSKERKEEMRASGQLVPLRTTLETRARENLVEVFVAHVPTKKASICLDAIRRIIPNDGGLDLQHLRRFAKLRDLPESVKQAFDIVRSQTTASSESAEVTIMVENTSESANEIVMGLFLIIGSTNILPESAVLEGLSSTVPDLQLFSIPVPLLAPTTPEQAKQWSAKYWPTVWKKSNPFGPHMSLMARTADEIRGETQRWMDLAEAAAQSSKMQAYGEAFGVVVVERRNGVGHAIAVAGDARWKDWPHKSGPGNVSAHAVMRAIGMVAEGLKAKEASSGIVLPRLSPDDVEIFQDTPISAVEKENADTSDNTSGYLCFDLEIYCTHEPCVMCSMAIVHSRFGRLVFGKKMTETGGICAEDDGLGCGLWWRKELNWTMLAWQYVQHEKRFLEPLDLALHA